MDPNAILGMIIIVAALGVLLGLVAWSRRRIRRIGRNGYGSARAIEKELRGD